MKRRNRAAYSVQRTAYSGSGKRSTQYAVLGTNQESGIALIIVVSVLAIAGIMAVSFAFSQRLELKAAANYQLSVKAGYLAEAGIRHAVQLLKEEKGRNAYDSYTELWSANFQGSEIDNDGDGTPDSRWFDFLDEESAKGRYAVLVLDEAGKINLNTAGFHNTSPLKITEGWSPFEVNIQKLFDLLAIPNSKELMESVLDYRYGGEEGLKGGIDGLDNDLDGAVDEKGYPGTDDPSFDDNGNSRILAADGIDNNADGVRDEAGEGVNEPMEHDPIEPRGDDRVFLTGEQVKGVEGMTEAVFQQLRLLIGTHSADKELNSHQRNKICLNLAGVDQLHKIFRDRGVGQPALKAVRLRDWLDSDSERSSLVKFVRTLTVSDIGAMGSWEWAGSHYSNKVPGSEPGRWRWSGIPSGDYYLTVFGISADDVIGDVTINGETVTEMKHGDVFVTSLSNKVKVDSDTGVTLQIQNNRTGAESECVFKGFELEPENGVPSGFEPVPVYGVEGIRINEVMARPVVELNAISGPNPGGDWTREASYYVNREPGGGTVGEGTWEWEGIPNGTYYVDLFGSQEGETVGDVEIKGKKNAHLKSGERFSQTVTVSGGYLRVEIQNNEESANCSFAMARLSQQPDAEYAELINISQQPVSVGGWTLEGPGPEGWPATIPIETEPVPPGGYLVLAVDLDDGQTGISGNGISFRKKWPDTDGAVQLQFKNSVSETADLLKDDLAMGSESIRLKNTEGQIVDEVEYPANPTPQKSLERGSPADDKDSNSNGLYDGFFVTTDPGGGTPGRVNQNSGLVKEYDEFGDPVYHDIGKEVWIRDRPLPNFGVLVELPLPEWTHWDLGDLALFVDDITLHASRFEAEGHQQGISGWLEVQQSAPLTHIFRSQEMGEVGEWKWDKKDLLRNGYYLLRLFGRAAEGMECSLRLEDGTWTEFTPALIPDSGGSAVYGVVRVGTGEELSTEKRTLSLRIRNASASGTATFDYLTLEPVSSVYGKINLNTAPSQVLQALPGVDQSFADEIIVSRPLGDEKGLKRGIGDLITKGILDPERAEDFKQFGQIANLVTVRSDVYEVIATGQIVRGGEILAEKRIRVVVER